MDVFVVLAFASLEGFMYQVFERFKFLCYVTFIFQIKLINFVLFFNHCFHFFIYPRRLPIVKNLGFMGNKICHDLKNSFIKNQILVIYTLVRKSFFQLNWNICILIVIGDSFIWKWIENVQVKFRVYHLMMAIRVK